MHLENSDFLTRLAELFEARKNKGSVFLTTKRLTYESESTPDQDATMSDPTEAAIPSTSTSTSTPTGSNEKEFPMIVRATDGKGKKDIKVKLSTIVQPNDYLSFTDQYTSILRSNLTSGLRPKRKRTTPSSKKSKSKSKSTSSKTKKEGGGEEDSSSERRNLSKGVGSFVSRLPKVVGPRRGNGRKKRSAAQERRDQAVKKIRKAREERQRRSEGQAL